MAIVFLIRKESETSRVYVRFKLSGHFDITAKTNTFIDSKFWNKEINGIFERTKDAKAKVDADELDKLKKKIELEYSKSSNKLGINKQWLEEVINPPALENTTTTDNLANYFDRYILFKPKLTEGTKKKIRVVQGLVRKFEQYMTTEKNIENPYLIKNVDPDFALNFQRFCTSKGYSHNTISQAIKTIKFICNHSIIDDKEISPKLNRIAIDWEPTDKTYLTTNELKLIEKVKLNAEHLNNSRDWLLISCETAQRVSDLLSFNVSQIRKESDGHWYLDLVQKKTKQPNTIYLTPTVRKILSKREGNFPDKISDQHYNEHIKEICRIAGLTKKEQGSKKVMIAKKTYRKASGMYPKWELVTSKIGRKSFASNYYGKIPTSLLIAQTGHSTEKMFRVYMGISDSEHSKQLGKAIRAL